MIDAAADGLREPADAIRGQERIVCSAAEVDETRDRTAVRRMPEDDGTAPPGTGKNRERPGTGTHGTHWLKKYSSKTDRPRLQHCLRATGFLPCPAGSVAAAALTCPASTSMSVQHAAIAQHASSVRRSVLPSLPPSPPRSRAAPSGRRRGRRRMQEPLSRGSHFNVLFQPMRPAAPAGARPLGLYRRARPAVTSSDMV